MSSLPISFQPRALSVSQTPPARLSGLSRQNPSVTFEGTQSGLLPRYSAALLLGLMGIAGIAGCSSQPADKPGVTITGEEFMKVKTRLPGYRQDVSTLAYQIESAPIDEQPPMRKEMQEAIAKLAVRLHLEVKEFDFSAEMLDKISQSVQKRLAEATNATVSQADPGLNQVVSDLQKGPLLTAQAREDLEKQLAEFSKTESGQQTVVVIPKTDPAEIPEAGKPVNASEILAKCLNDIQSVSDLTAEEKTAINQGYQSLKDGNQDMAKVHENTIRVLAQRIPDPKKRAVVQAIFTEAGRELFGAVSRAELTQQQALARLLLIFACFFAGLGMLMSMK